MGWEWTGYELKMRKNSGLKGMIKREFFSRIFVKLELSWVWIRLKLRGKVNIESGSGGGCPSRISRLLAALSSFFFLRLTFFEFCKENRFTIGWKIGGCMRSRWKVLKVARKGSMKSWGRGIPTGEEIDADWCLKGWCWMDHKRWFQSSGQQWQI